MTERGPMSGFNPQSEIEPQITQIDTDFEEVVKATLKPF